MNILHVELDHPGAQSIQKWYRAATVPKVYRGLGALSQTSKWAVHTWRYKQRHHNEERCDSESLPKPQCQHLTIPKRGNSTRGHRYELVVQGYMLMQIVRNSRNVTFVANVHHRGSYVLGRHSPLKGGKRKRNQGYVHPI